MILHEAIYELCPNAVSIYHETPVDADGNELEYDREAAQIRSDELVSQMRAQRQSQIDAKETALNKLKRLGLTEEEALALISK